ncbi:MAG: prepilin-type N-terminal cleavage/methylation domain-containing protein [Lentisphaeria bacterium]|nr:prepilin-type N-terminal cleavage/methylation domain-containing protein [Lentisphaeria bacterium]
MRKNKIHNPVRKGFTLIELVVAMAVFSLMMMLMMRFFTDTQRLWSRSEDRANMYADARVAMDLMSSALQSVYYQESSNMGQSDYHQERFWISCSAANNGTGRIEFPVNLSRNSPLYPSTPAGHSDFAKPFYLAFWLDNNNVLHCANDNGATDFVNSSGAPTCSTDPQEIIENVTHLSFRLFSGGFSVLNGSNYVNQAVFPHSVQITMKMMPKAAFDTWRGMFSGSETADAQRFREENEYEFVRIIYLGVY